MGFIASQPRAMPALARLLPLLALSQLAAASPLPKEEDRVDYQVTTWTETHTYTSTIGTIWDPVPAPTDGAECTPQAADQEPCGTICCAGYQTCAFTGQCSIKPGFEEGTTIIITQDGSVTTQFSAPYRVTETTVIIGTGPQTTRTDTAGADVPTETGDADNADDGGSSGGGGGGGLSGGEIAGIVIGSIAGAMLLGLIIFCCIVRGIWNLIFGRKKKEDHHSHYDSSGYARRDHHSGWFGGGRRSSSHGGEKKSSGLKWFGLAGVAATLLALLNFRKKDKPARKSSRSRYSDSYYSYSYSSPSKPSLASISQRKKILTIATANSSGSGRKTTRSHRTGRTGRSRDSRQSRYRSESRR
jgi:hypothetical protein